MRKKNKQLSQSNRIEIILKIAISASLGSLGIVLSTIVVFIPNFELISVTIFLISLMFGIFYGLLTAISVSLVYEFIVTAIVGPASYLIIFKLACYILLALFAGLSRKVILKLSFWELGIIGSIFALFYDILITIGFQIAVIQEKIAISYLMLLLAEGVFFTITHVISNFILFSMTKTILNWIVTAFKARGLKQLMLPSLIESDDSKISMSSEGGIK